MRIGIIIKGNFNDPFTEHYSNQEIFLTDDQLLVHELERRGHAVSAVPWDSAIFRDSRRQKSFDLYLIRSPWDFLLRVNDFLEWLQLVEETALPILNPAHVVRSNISKRYLLHIAANGVLTIPTTVIAPHDEGNLTNVIENAGWNEFVIKPAVSGGAYRAYRGTTDNMTAASAAASELLQIGDVVVQKYMPNIETTGEWSFVFFNGAYSHAVRKVPKPGEWREQAQYGGQAVSATPTAALLEQAKFAEKVAANGALYARIDGIEEQGKLFVNEVELIDPRLFFATCPNAAGRFADAIESSFQ
jgi:glutathione synthase/RimK-type ligase-like ATP-grasp enzyme